MKIICKIKDLRAVLKSLNPALPKARNERHSVICEITLEQKQLTVSVPGASFHCPAEANEMKKAQVPLSVIEGILHGWDKPVLEFSINNGAISFKHTTIESEHIKIFQAAEPIAIETPDETKPSMYWHSILNQDVFAILVEYSQDNFGESAVILYGTKREIFDKLHLLLKVCISHLTNNYRENIEKQNDIQSYFQKATGSKSAITAGSIKTFLFGEVDSFSKNISSIQIEELISKSKLNSHLKHLSKCLPGYQGISIGMESNVREFIDKLLDQHLETSFPNYNIIPDYYFIGRLTVLNASSLEKWEEPEFENVFSDFVTAYNNKYGKYLLHLMEELPLFTAPEPFP